MDALRLVTSVLAAPLRAASRYRSLPWWRRWRWRWWRWWRLRPRRRRRRLAAVATHLVDAPSIAAAVSRVRVAPSLAALSCTVGTEKRPKPSNASCHCRRAGARWYFNRTYCTGRNYRTSLYPTVNRTTAFVTPLKTRFIWRPASPCSARARLFQIIPLVDRVLTKAPQTQHESTLSDTVLRRVSVYVCR